MTTSANDDMAALHDRMSVILEPDDWPLWLGEVASDHTALLRPEALCKVHLWRVGEPSD